MPSGKSGEVSRKDIESALRAFENDLKKKGTPSSYTVTADEAIAVLLALDLCIRVEDFSELYQIPALLENSISRHSWKEDAIFDVYRGQRYECAHPVDIISPSSFVVFQSRCSRVAATSREAWKDGVKVVKIVGDKVVECLVDLGIKKGHCCIDLVVRWSNKSACNNVAKEFVAQLKDMIVGVCDERSPDVVLNWYYLDSKHLKRLDEDPAIYSISDVQRKLKEKTFDHVLFSVQRRTEKRHYSSVRDLVIMDESDEKVNDEKGVVFFYRLFFRARFLIRMELYQYVAPLKYGKKNCFIPLSKRMYTFRTQLLALGVCLNRPLSVSVNGHAHVYIFYNFSLRSSA